MILKNSNKENFFSFLSFLFPSVTFEEKMYIKKTVALNNLASNTVKEEHTIVSIIFKDVMVKLKQFI